MITNLHSITLDTLTASSTVENVVIGDTANVFTVYITTNGTALDISDATLIQAIVRHGSASYVQACALDSSAEDDNALLFTLNASTIVEGYNECEIQVYSDDDTLITSAKFIILLAHLWQMPKH